MADHPRYGRKAPAQPTFDAVDKIVDRAHRQSRIDVAVKVHNLAIGCFAHAHIMHFAKRGAFVASDASASRISVTRPASASRPASMTAGSGSMWVSTSTSGPSSSRMASSSPTCGLVRRRQRQGALHLKVGGNRQPIADGLHRDVVDGQSAIAGNEHHPLAHGLVAECVRFGGDRGFGCGKRGADRLRKPILDSRHPIERQGAADTDSEFDKERRAGWPRADPFDIDDARNSSRNRRHLVADARRRSVGQGIDGAAAEAPAGNANEHGDDQSSRRVAQA